jgi:hypothetical protein
VTDTAEPLRADRPLAERLARAFASLAEGLPNLLDESTDYFRPFWVELSPDTELSAESFGRAVKVGPQYSIDLAPAGEFFDAAKNWGDPKVEATCTVLQSLMSASLGNLSLALARKPGVTRVRTWLFGQFKAGEQNAFVGLATESTET